MTGTEEWKPRKPHWWADWWVKTISAMVAVFALIVGILAYVKKPPATPPPVVNNYLPNVNGLAGQENPQIDKSCSDDSSNKAGWGPDRPVVSGPTVLNWPSINADTDNPNYGDERNFYRVKDAGNTSPGGWSNTIQVQRGKKYLLQVYIHNSAGDFDYMAAKGVRLAINLPACTGRRISSAAFVTSSNSYPGQVWGGVTFTSDQDFNVAYYDGNAAVLNNVNPNPGFSIPGNDFLTSKGQLVGFDQMDGIVRGGYKYSLFFTFTVLVQ
ncbi:hypothetical protein ACWDSJ_09165 [Nocardia sp. NPDC003482]